MQFEKCQKKLSTNYTSFGTKNTPKLKPGEFAHLHPSPNGENSPVFEDPFAKRRKERQNCPQGYVWPKLSPFDYTRYLVKRNVLIRRWVTR